MRRRNPRSVTFVSRRLTAARASLVGAALAGLFGTESLRAEDRSLEALLPKLSAWSARLEAALNRSVFTMTGHTDEVDGDGRASDHKEGVFRVDARGERVHVQVLRYAEDGEDKTAEAREKVRRDEEKRDKKHKEPDEVLRMPFLQPELGKYSFRIGESDPRSPARVRVYFSAKQRAKNLGNGSAWVDTRTGEVLTMGVSPSKTSLFVDFINVTLEFGDVTPAGPGISRIGFDARGGFLFFHKRVRGEATLSNYQVK